MLQLFLRSYKLFSRVTAEKLVNVYSFGLLSISTLEPWKTVSNIARWGFLRLCWTKRNNRTPHRDQYWPTMCNTWCSFRRLWRAVAGGGRYGRERR